MDLNGLLEDDGVRLVEGRDFTEHDVGKEVTVAIVNQKFARHFFGEKSPIGRRIGFGGRPDAKLRIEIVGVTEDTLYEGPREGTRRQVFAPFLQADFPAGVAFYVRTALDSESMFGTLRRKVQEIDAAMPVYEMKTLNQRMGRSPRNA
jgi:hypothetical protein